jgi:serine/threonine-protein kinase
VGTTDVVSKDKVGQPKTDPEKHPLGAAPLDLDNSTIRVSDSVKLDVQRRLEEHRASQPAKAHEPTVLKPRALALDLGATTPAEPPPPTRSPALIGVSVVVGLIVLGGGGYALFGRETPPQPVEVVDPVNAPAAPVVAELKPPEPAPAVAPPVESPAEAATDAAVAVDAMRPPPVPLQPVVVPTPEPDKPAVPAPKPLAAAVRFGTVSIKAVPYAEILVDGRKMGEAQGVRQLKLPIGSHKVTLIHPKRSETFSVTVDGKAPAELSFTASP